MGWDKAVFRSKVELNKICPNINSNLYNNLIFPENSKNMKACSIQRYDKNRDVIGIYILSSYPNFLKSI
jgi:hypothetical protein